MKLLWLGFGALLAYLQLTYNYKPDYSQFDMKRCYAKPSITYWDGPDGTRTTKSDYKSVVICWPKHGTFMLGNAAMAWDSRGIKK